MRSIITLSLLQTYLARADQVNLGELSRVVGTCFYETNEFFGSFPKDAEYKTDLTRLRPDTFT